MTLYYSDELVRLYLGDAREVLPDIPSKRAVLVTDPPYGIDLDTGQSKSVTKTTHRKVHGDAEAFDPAWLLERFDRAVIFGGNNFAARNAGLYGVGAEIDEAYCEVIADRLSNQTVALDFDAEPAEVPLDLGLETENLK